jgi:hypothetical protein
MRGEADFKAMIEQLKEFLESEVEYLWIAEDPVYLDGNWESFFHDFDQLKVDLLATEIRTRAEDPDWTWWSSLKDEEEPAPADTGIAALLPLIRLSRPAAEAIMAGIAAGWNGHREALVPTLVHRAGLTIEDIGGSGGFTPEERKGRWYDRRTWHWQGPVEHVPGMLHFPVPVPRRPLAPSRIAAVEGSPRMLYVSPVGAPAGELLPEALTVFQSAGADCLLLQYDEAELPVPEGVRVIRDRGYKWQLALRHLHPETIAEYDYIFFWDDDIGTAGFDPVRFVQIMQVNRLDMAQPAIESPHGLSHAITRRRPCPMPFRSTEGEASHPVVGRMTNFVEIMVPVFNRKTWAEFYGYLDPDNRSGWGYDYIPAGRKGIVDVLPVIHTRAVQSIGSESEKEIRRFLDDQGLFRFQPVDQGLLFES